MAVVNVKVAHIRPQYDNLKEWMQNPNHVYIGRKGIVFIDGKRFPEKDSFWHNPYKIEAGVTREQVLYWYEVYIRNNLVHDYVRQELLSLKGKVLGCWCAPEPCHGHVLLKLIEELSK